MNLKLLQDMLALIEERSFTAAAQRRNVTQPAFSRRIQSLESWLGHRIMERSGPHVRLSQAALRAEPRIRNLVTQMQGLRRFMELDSMQKAHVVFTMPHTLSIYLYSRIIEALGFGVKPGSQPWMYSLRSAYKQECIGIFMRGDADILICDEETGKTSIPSSFQYRSALLNLDILVPVANRDWWESNFAAGAGDRPVPLIAYPEESYLWSLISERCLPLTLEAHSVEILCETALSVAVRELVLRCHGVGWLPQSFVNAEIASGKLVNLQSSFGSVPMENICYISKAADETNIADIFEKIKSVTL